MTDCWICASATRPCAWLPGLAYAECPSCGHVFREDDAALAVADVYTSGDYTEVRGDHYLADLQARRSDARRRLEFLERAGLRPPGRLLDIGAAAGAFVAEAGAAGWQAEGVEPTPQFAGGAELDVVIHQGTLEDAALTDGSLDVATMWHVLEHIPRPLPEMRRVLAALKPGGALVVEVPNGGGYDAHARGVDWPSLEPEVHVSQFCASSLRQLLTRAGFTVRDVHTVPISVYLDTRAKLGLGHVAHRVKAARALGSLRGTHPDGFELLRAVATSGA